MDRKSVGSGHKKKWRKVQNLHNLDAERSGGRSVGELSLLSTLASGRTGNVLGAIGGGRGRFSPPFFPRRPAFFDRAIQLPQRGFRSLPAQSVPWDISTDHPD